MYTKFKKGFKPVERGFLYKYQVGPAETLTPEAELHKALDTPHDWVIIEKVMVNVDHVRNFRICKLCGYVEVDTALKQSERIWLPTLNHGLAMLIDYHNSVRSYEAKVK